MPSGRMAKTLKISVVPDNIHFPAAPGSNLMTLLARHSIFLAGTCGGKGRCKKCLVLVTWPGSAKSHEVLACQFKVETDLVVEIPPHSRVDFVAQQRIETTAARITRTLKPSPSVQTQTIAWDRSIADRQPSLTGALAAVMSAGGLWRKNYAFALPTLAEEDLPGLVDLETGQMLKVVIARDKIVRALGPRTRRPVLGLAVDLGTTTVAASLVDLETCTIKGLAATLNQQIQFGADVISRIDFSLRGRKQRRQLADALAQTLQLVAQTLASANNAKLSDIYQIVLAGNTTMVSTLLALDCAALVSPPYRAPTSEAMTLAAADVESLRALGLAPWTELLFLPAVGSFVGSDLVAGLLVATMRAKPKPFIFVDVGTNGEVVVSTGQRFWVSSAAAGPAFEGGQIECGMPALPGAIWKAGLLGDRIEYQVVGDARPAGICGSGLIDICAALLDVGVIESSGRFSNGLSSLPDGVSDHLCERNGQSALCICDDVFLTQEDIRNLQLAKSAIRSCIELLLDKANIKPESIERLLIAGAFGSHIDVASAERIGLIPRLPNARKAFLGNTSLAGALAVLLAGKKLAEAKRICQRSVYVNLATEERFEESFTRNLRFG